ncbi:formylmethanofuran--tetrahydromethanopterin N-formyltransferase [Beggiatoa leptomitoformis]|uniref:Formylmethanofuran--tetrahydromethanopterin formyltransferase n=1 Tax=Beggiatoa leptomitoformis TaxID=288004 RepID=A0A2N9YGC3_9GAMM|nr:formylmethanofuran--tetrahydromethanopterin N-formyltransferase [Beggiatoa leptomitoformis]ALG68085.1 formylmethanofuran--tetrahydromethanopterin N-formyltransferase [Beggiatoa leptomitoformis]AUI69621.1 formylmethanofuran--tetrahydromethanopterin N-formyltransferase [Beggiatoa leptomitoformis]
MEINGVQIDETFAEAFPMKATRLIVTAHNLKWAYTAAQAMTGFATSVIACGCEAGIECELSADETPDGRVGVSILLFTMSSDKLIKQIQNRVGQCILTCPSTACFAGIYTDKRAPLGKNLRYFGDGWQISKVIGGKRYWRIPVMEGEFLCEETTGIAPAIGGGNFLILAASPVQALTASEHAIEAMRKVEGVIMPFPGGVVRSGSKVGSKYKGLIASSNQAFCPTLKGQVKSELDSAVGSVLEIVIDGLTDAAISNATRAGIQAVCDLGKANGVLRISAGNYGGKLGPYHFHLREIMQ